jgi:hypothetical protein
VEKAGRRFEDVVALGALAMEYHDAAGAPSTGISVKDKETYDIPLRTLIGVDTPNLYAAGRAADGDKYGGPLRVMGTALAGTDARLSWPVMGWYRTARMRRTTSFVMEMAKAKAIC